MHLGVATVIYPVTDLARAKATFTALLGTEPYVGYRPGDVEVGLDPNGRKGGAVACNEVADIRATLEAMLDAGAQTEEDVKDVGGPQSDRRAEGRRRQPARPEPDPVSGRLRGAR